jgi:predicted RNase H-like HicB family nuclease
MYTAPRWGSAAVRTWDETREEALANLEEVVKMVVAGMIEHGEPIAEIAPRGRVGVSKEPLVAVAV